jgi:hypothetical protein
MQENTRVILENLQQDQFPRWPQVSETTQAIARRNLLLSHTSAMLKQLQEQLNEFDAFVNRHFQGPWEAAGMSDDGRHWLDTVAL